MGGQSYVVRGPERQPLSDPDQIVGAMLGEAELQSISPPSGDQIIGAMWCGFLDVVGKLPPLDGALWDYAEHRRAIVDSHSSGGTPIAEMNGELRAAVQRYCLKDGRVRFPMTRRGWKAIFKNIARDPGYLNSFTSDLIEGHVGTTHGDRYGPPESMRQLDAAAGIGALSCFDAAASLQIGAKQMFMKKEYPFAAVPMETPEGQPDDLAEQGYANLINGPVVEGEILTSDLRDEVNAARYRISLDASLRPAELLDRNFRAQRRRLFAAKLPNVNFVQADITNREDVARVRHEHGLFDHVYIGMALNQIGQERIPGTLRNMLSLLNPKGKLVFWEIGRPDRRNKAKFYLYPRWNAWGLGYFGIHKDDDLHEIQHYFTFLNTRLTKGRVEDGLFDAGGNLLPMREHVVRAAGATVVNHPGFCRQDLCTSP